MLGEESIHKERWGAQSGESELEHEEKDILKENRIVAEMGDAHIQGIEQISEYVKDNESWISQKR